MVLWSYLGKCCPILFRCQASSGLLNLLLEHNIFIVKRLNLNLRVVTFDTLSQNTLLQVFAHFTPDFEGRNGLQLIHYSPSLQGGIMEVALHERF